MHTDATRGEACRAAAPPRNQIRTMWGVQRSPDVLVRAGAMLREARQKRGLSLRALSEKVGKSHVFLGEVERGDAALPVAIAPRLAEVLEIDLAVVLCAFQVVPQHAAKAFFDPDRMRAALAGGA